MCFQIQTFNFFHSLGNVRLLLCFGSCRVKNGFTGGKSRDSRFCVSLWISWVCKIWQLLFPAISKLTNQSGCNVTVISGVIHHTLKQAEKMLSTAKRKSLSLSENRSQGLAVSAVVYQHLFTWCYTQRAVSVYLCYECCSHADPYKLGLCISVYWPPMRLKESLEWIMNELLYSGCNSQHII